MKKGKIIFGILLLLIIVSIIYIYDSTKEISLYFENETINASFSKIDEQNKKNKEIIKISNNKKYTFNNAYIEIDPYKENPLSALLIFYEKNLSYVKVFVNSKLVSEIKGTNNYIIPIYYLKENYDNKITIVSETKQMDYYIKTKEIKHDTLLSNTNNTENKIYSVLTNNHIYNYDEVGSLVGSFNVGRKMFIKNNMIYTFMNLDENRFEYLVKMDMMGKIYEYYVIDKEYDEILNVHNNELILKKGSSFITYNLDKLKESNEVYFESIDKINKSVVIDNYLFIESNNSIIKYSLEKNKIDWIISNDSKIKKKYKKYLLETNKFPSKFDLISINGINEFIIKYKKNKKDYLALYKIENKKIKQIKNKNIPNNYVKNNSNINEILTKLNNGSFNEYDKNLDKVSSIKSNDIINITSLPINKSVMLTDEIKSNINVKNDVVDKMLPSKILKKIDKWEYKVEYNRINFKTDYNLKAEDELKIYLISEFRKSYEYVIKKKNSNEVNYIHNLNIPDGQYALFIKLNDKFYYTNMVYGY